MICPTQPDPIQWVGTIELAQAQAQAQAGVEWSEVVLRRNKKGMRAQVLCNVFPRPPRPLRAWSVGALPVCMYVYMYGVDQTPNHPDDLHEARPVVSRGREGVRGGVQGVRPRPRLAHP